MEYAQFSGGMFIDYLSIEKDFGDNKGRERDAMQDFEDVQVVWDIAGAVVEVPVKAVGSKITLTGIRDIGRFVAAACVLQDGK